MSDSDNEALRKQLAEARGQIAVMRGRDYRFTPCLGCGNLTETMQGECAQCGAPKDHIKRLQAEARQALLASKDTVFANKKLQEALELSRQVATSLDQSLQAANARIAELEAECCRTSGLFVSAVASAERAEAECKAMRDALKPFVVTAEKFGNWGDHERVNVSIKLGHLRKASAALNPAYTKK